MEVINNPIRLQQFIDRSSLLKHLESLDLEFLLLRFTKGEFLQTPNRLTEYLLFVEDGLIQIYDISSEGRKTPIALESELTMLGDIEFALGSGEPYFVEAATEVTSAALSINETREVLKQDVPFLQFLTESLAMKLKRSGQFDTVAQTVKERVLFYMEDVYPEGILKGIENTAVQLQCSRRQLQRALKELCDEDEIEKIGKGAYRRKS